MAPTTTVSQTPPDHSRRLDWLDGLRGFAALAVVFEHSLNILFVEVRESASPWFDFGRYGVFVFFLVSGYIIPASLERRRNVGEFWIGRLFRLWPLAVVAAVAMLALVQTGATRFGPPQSLSEQPVTALLAHLTMLQDLLGTGNVVNVFWTLSYEMAFYLLVTVLFVAGTSRAAAPVALTLGVAAATVGVMLPLGLLSSWSRAGTVLAVCLLLAGGLWAAVRGGRALKGAGCAVLAAVALGLVATNSNAGAMEGLSILATMFAGTVLYQLEKGRIPARLGLPVVIAVPLLTVAGGVQTALGDGPKASGEWGWTTAVAAAWLTFLVGMALRERRVPRPLPWLGRISYSLYLLHQLVLQAFWSVAGDEAARLPLTDRLLLETGLMAAALAVAALGYHLVELPVQDLGRRVVRRGRARPATPAKRPAFSSAS